MIVAAEKFFSDIERDFAKSKKFLKIRYMDEPPQYAAYRFDNFYVINFYSHIKKVNNPTIACYRGGTVADFIDAQLNQIIKEIDERDRRLALLEAAKASTPQARAEPSEQASQP